MLTRGELRVLALFDKPDPLDGPFFQETIYVTPSRLVAEMQEEIAECDSQAAHALEFTEGSIYAELRLAKEGPSVIEVNPRSIGGLCSRVLRFGAGMSLEELIIRHALDEDFELPKRQWQATGVMKIPTRAEILMYEEIERFVRVAAEMGVNKLRVPAANRWLGGADTTDQNAGRDRRMGRARATTRRRRRGRSNRPNRTTSRSREETRSRH